MQLVDLLLIFALLTWGSVAFSLVVKRNLYRLPSFKRAPIPPFISQGIFWLFVPFQTSLFYFLPLSKLGFQLSSLLAITLSASSYLFLSLLPPFRSLWIRQGALKFYPSVKLALSTLFLTIPWVLSVELITSSVIEGYLGYPRIEQDAISYLLSLSNNRLLLALAAITIATIVPLFEELLFRGFLQNSLRAFMPKVPCLILTALIFTLFHFSASQGASNWIILPPLFLMALVLGWAYEKTGSLLAPLTVHMTFNGISVFFILTSRI